MRRQDNSNNEQNAALSDYMNPQQRNAYGFVNPITLRPITSNPYWAGSSFAPRNPFCSYKHPILRLDCTECQEYCKILQKNLFPTVNQLMPGNESASTGQINGGAATSSSASTRSSSSSQGARRSARLKSTERDSEERSSSRSREPPHRREESLKRRYISSAAVPSSSTSSRSTIPEFLHLPLHSVSEVVVFPETLKSFKPVRTGDVNEWRKTMSLTALQLQCVRDQRLNIQIRVYTEANGRGEICYPDHCEIFVDERMIAFQGTQVIGGLRKCVITEPILLGKYCTMRTSYPLKIRFRHTANNSRFMVAIVLVKTRTPEHLRDSPDIRHIPAISTKNQIMKAFGGDDGVALVNLKVSLACPCDRKVMKIPSRSYKCDHLQCFDLFNYILMNQKRQVWKCPVCCKPAPYCDIRIDDYFADVIKNFKCSADPDVELLPDGGWKNYSANSDNLITLDDEGDAKQKEANDEPVAQSSSMPASGNHNINAAADSSAPRVNGADVLQGAPPAKKARVIDVITLSDSEEEEESATSEDSPQSSETPTDSSPQSSTDDKQCDESTKPNEVKEEPVPTQALNKAGNAIVHQFMRANTLNGVGAQPTVLDVITLSDSDDDEQPHSSGTPS